MHSILLLLIQVLHTLFILFVILAPISNNNYILFLHSIMVPFLWLHWCTNSNVCALTVVEKLVRKKLYNDEDDEECFTCKLIEPVYDVHKNYEAYCIFIYVFAFLLWTVSVYKLTRKYKNGEIKSFFDLLKY